MRRHGSTAKPWIATMTTSLLCIVIGMLLVRGDCCVDGRQPCRQPRINFRWNASVNAATGLASSMERSEFHTLESKIGKSTGKNQQNVMDISRDFVKSWPNFICSATTTFGLFRIVNVSRTRPSTIGNTKEYVACLKPQFIPITLLAFGELSKRLQGQDGYQVWEMPIRGGLLALPSWIRPSQRSQGDDWGKLTFGIRKIRRPKRSGRTSLPQLPQYELTTKIVGYRPRLVGSPTKKTAHSNTIKNTFDQPRSRSENNNNFITATSSHFRRWIYLHSQSYVHAYVTWRFHRSWQDRLRHSIQ